MALPNGWAYRATLTVDHTKVITADVTNFPALFNWTGTQSTSNLPLAMFNSTYSSVVAKSTGADVRFSTDALGLSECAFEIVTFGTSAGGTGITAQIWVRVPTLSASVDTVIYVWWHNPLATAYAVNATYGRNNTWINGYSSVYHLETDNYTDSVGAFDGTNVSSTNSAAQFDVGKSFNGTSTAITCGDQDLTTGTWSAWAKPNASQVNYAKVLNKSTVSAAPWTMYNITADATATTKLWGTEISVGTTQYSSGKVASLSTSVFSYLVGRYDGTNLSFWINGAQSGTNTNIVGSIATNNVLLNIGRSGFTTPSEWFSGIIDEVRIQTTARTNGWITTEYNSGSSPQTFVTQSAVTRVSRMVGSFFIS